MEYVYQCKNCGKEFSISGRFESLVGLRPECPECKSANVVKKISASSFILKGKDFYSTSNRKEVEE
jgi:putative FmdB family regulatory protein